MPKARSRPQQSSSKHDTAPRQIRARRPRKETSGNSEAEDEIHLPPQHDWRTTDEDEVNRRRLRAREESFVIRNLDTRFPIFSNFSVGSGSGLTYAVEIRDVAGRQFACTCQDFRKNGLGTCKHVEAVLLHLEGRFRRLFGRAVSDGSERIDLVPDAEAGGIRVERGWDRLSRTIRRDFDSEGRLSGTSMEEALPRLEKLRMERLPELRLSQEIAPWLEERRRQQERKALRHEYELRVQSGEWPAHETCVPLFPYQREGMLHLAFTERALLADEMGLGKTIQAIAACALLRRLGRAQRVLVVTPASLKSEWEEQIARFTELPCRLVFGKPSDRWEAYDAGTFFTIVNYEQIIRDALEVNARFRPDVVVLDEAQRIKNWSTQTAQAVKRLESRYAFVLTGTPIENRIDELYSLMDFLEPRALGPLFRFNRDFYKFDERGRPEGYQHLDRLNERIAPYMRRRRKSDVEAELPDRTDRQHFVKLTPKQQAVYDENSEVVARLAMIAKRRPLRKQEQERLMIHLAMMRMVCDTTYILDQNVRDCPKLAELEKVLEECRDNEGVKVIIFSEWEKMLELVRDLCRRLKIGFAWHTGSVPQQRRRAEINAFKGDPGCLAFLSTDSGSTGLNLQNASVVINCDLPWNPAKLEQRIARAWRKHQTRPVTVINLVAESTIEHRMLDTLANKQALSDGVLDRRGDLETIPLRSGGQAFLSRLKQLVAEPSKPADADLKSPISDLKPAKPTDRPRAFAEEARRQLGPALVSCEERFPATGVDSVLYVVVESQVPLHRNRLETLHRDLCADLESVAPVRLEVIDRATHEALERLIAAGLIAPVSRAARPLSPESEAPIPLSAAEQARAKEQRELAARKLKMARLLAEGGLSEEARPPLLEAVQTVGAALAIEGRLPAPGTPDEALLPPLLAQWGLHATALKAVLELPDRDLSPAIRALGELLTAS
ncbi:MAG: DEAD/DEAH box helicase [Verrucomicrobiales bacterium]|nr:DEAD/DEAH box helicase [Verrucomicrobiales bacterium]